MNLLVTGGNGFIGSNFIAYMLKNDFKFDLVINLDKMTYAGQGENLKHMGLDNDKRYQFVFGDICDARNLQKNVFDKFLITHIVNFAAESHVDRSIESGLPFIQTNVLGTATLLELVKNNKILKKFIQVGTDEVYGSLSFNDESSCEEDPTSPRSPYSASKESADKIALSYFITHGVPVNVTRSSNNYGPYQFPEKLIPLFVTNLMRGKKVPLYGDGKNIRDWLHVEDNCRAIRDVLFFGNTGEIYNVGGGNEFSNKDITNLILYEFGFGEEMIEGVADRKGHDLRYALNCDKIKHHVGWVPSRIGLVQGLKETIDWYKKNEDWWGALKK